MSIPKKDAFQLRISTRDKYGKVTVASETTYYGYIEREEQFRSDVKGTNVIGKGMVFSSMIEGLASVGQEIIIDGDVYSIIKCFDAHDMSKYNHTELVYG